MRIPAPECYLVAQRHVFYRFNEAILDFRAEVGKPLYFTMEIGPLKVEETMFGLSIASKKPSMSRRKPIPLAGPRRLRTTQRAPKAQ